MNNRQPQRETYRSSSIHRSLDGSIDVNFYRRRAHNLRSEAAWDIITHMSRMLPFFRHHEASPHADRTNCSMI
ncbi:hypothetical protein [Sedimenticola sp.]|uniref:hypothetical protein n=1 Tax=Sedimenticola sp. TaxID=1940285 RepID=UPI003D0FF212